MVDSPSPDNSLALSVDDLIHQAIFNLALTAAETELISQAPWLKLPGINAVFTFTMNRIGTLLYRPLARLATFEVIDFQTDEQREKYGQAEGELRAAHLAGDAEVIAAASANFDIMLGNLIHYDGSVPI